MYLTATKAIGAWTEKDKDHKIRVGDRLESKKCKSGKGRQLFYRDGLNRLVNMQGLCLEVEGNFHEANVNLRTCSNNSYQFWKFVKKSSFPPPPPPLPRLEPRSSSRLVPSTSRYSCFVGLTEAIKVQSCKQTAEYRWSWDGHKLKALGSGKCLVFRTPTSGGSGWKSLAKLNNKLGPREVVLQPCRSAPNLEIRKINGKVMISSQGFQHCLAYSKKSGVVEGSLCTKGRTDQEFWF